VQAAPERASCLGAPCAAPVFGAVASRAWDRAIERLIAGINWKAAHRRGNYTTRCTAHVHKAQHTPRRKEKQQAVQESGRLPTLPSRFIGGVCVSQTQELQKYLLGQLLAMQPSNNHYSCPCMEMMQLRICWSCPHFKRKSALLLLKTNAS